MNRIPRTLLAAFLVPVLTASVHAETIPVFTQGDLDRPFVDVFGSGLYAATFVQGAGYKVPCLQTPLKLVDSNWFTDQRKAWVGE